MGNLLNSFKGGTSTRKIIGTAFGVVDVAANRLAPDLAPEKIMAVIKTNGFRALTPSVANAWLFVGMIMSMMFSPLSAFFVAVWAMWYGANRHGVALTVGGGAKAFRDHIWGTHRQQFFVWCAASFVSAICAVGTVLVNASGRIGTTVGGEMVIYIGANILLYWWWKSLVKNSVDEAAAVPEYDEAAIFRAQLIVTLGITEKVLTADLIHYDLLGGFNIQPVPLAAIKPGMQEAIRTRALEHLPDFELISASASHIQFARVTENTLAARALHESSGGAVIARRAESSSTSMFSPEDFI